MKLYHGSNILIDKIELAKSKPNKDFGKGFYLSDTYPQAMEMAKFKSLQLGGEPAVSSFEFDKDGMWAADLNIKVFTDYSEEWIDFIIKNRNGKINHNFDFVYGPIANDKVGRQLRLFNDGDITRQQLMERLKYFKGISFQYFFGTEMALKFLKRVVD